MRDFRLKPVSISPPEAKKTNVVVSKEQVLRSPLARSIQNHFKKWYPHLANKDNEVEGAA